MIPVQKSFPPELLRRWRKVMRERRQCTCHPDDRPITCQHKYAARDCQSEFDRWKLAQDRATLVYTLVASAVLALITFVVTNGGCK